MKTLILESFYSGSHRLWADNLQRKLGADCDLWTLPGRYWKWRMHGAAVSFAQRWNNSEASYQRIIASSLMDLACFKGLTTMQEKGTTITMYMHENQICYPVSDEQEHHEKERDHHYGYINFTSCLAADDIAFNSHYHRHVFLKRLPDYLKMYPDDRQLHLIDTIAHKSKVEYIPLDLLPFYIEEKAPSDPPIILWNHRWEYDKGPDEFFSALIDLQEEGLAFKLMVLGESYSRVPSIFEKAKDTLAERIIHWGYCEDRDEYISKLKRCHILPVTSIHEFFGISVIEAIAAGCTPLLPDRLSYPELMKGTGQEYLYAPGTFKDRLRHLIQNYEFDPLTMKEIRRFHAF